MRIRSHLGHFPSTKQFLWNDARQPVKKEMKQNKVNKKAYFKNTIILYAVPPKFTYALFSISFGAMVSSKRQGVTFWAFIVIDESRIHELKRRSV